MWIETVFGVPVPCSPVWLVGPGPGPFVTLARCRTLVSGLQEDRDLEERVDLEEELQSNKNKGIEMNCELQVYATAQVDAPAQLR